MTKNEAVRIAHEFGICDEDGCDDNSIYMDEKLQEFAKFIASLERNRLANELQKMPLNDTANSIAIWIREQE